MPNPLDLIHNQKLVIEVLRAVRKLNLRMGCPECGGFDTEIDDQIQRVHHLIGEPDAPTSSPVQPTEP